MIEVANGEEFVLEGYDPVTKTVSVQWRTRISDIEGLKEIIGPDCSEDPALSWTYHDFSRQEMRRIGKLCIPPIVPDRSFTAIGRPSKGFDDVPYMIHTNFELPLMLEGRKPFAVFGDAYPSKWFDEHLAPFEQFVRTGRIVRRIVDTSMPQLKRRRPEWDRFRNVYFALPGEEWRIDAYISLFDEHLRSGTSWDDDKERLQGSLLGYEDWQNDWWINQRIKRRVEPAD
jgi:hypothetical protein